jgi:hypothetical protein
MICIFIATPIYTLKDFKLELFITQESRVTTVHMSKTAQADGTQCLYATLTNG